MGIQITVGSAVLENLASKDLSNVPNNDFLKKILDVDGQGSGLDADLVRGLPADFSANLSESGYQKLPSGLIIQWGIYDTLTNTSGSTAEGSVSFPIAFPNQCFQVIANPVNVPNDVWGAVSVRIVSVDTSSFTYNIDTTDPNQHITKNVRIRYIAIGY